MCIKLVIKTDLYYDARSEKHQILLIFFSFILIHSPGEVEGRREILVLPLVFPASYEEISI
jgi:hypothetical protein